MICKTCARGADVMRNRSAIGAEFQDTGVESYQGVARALHALCRGCDCQHGGVVAAGESDGETLDQALKGALNRAFERVEQRVLTGVAGVHREIGPGILTVHIDGRSGLPRGIHFNGTALPYVVQYDTDTRITGTDPQGSPEGVVITQVETQWYDVAEQLTKRHER